ncbi:MAG: alpha-glucosidase [Lachnospiraceae bacterium]|nr:alpha-glucosidase [Lachnospiraceae bacterium]
MILKYVYGTPIETDAVVKEVDGAEKNIPFFNVEKTEETVTFSYQMEEDDIVYGLGENVRGINKRGFLYVSNCSDDPCHREDTNSLYGAHNFILVDGKELFGVFVDFPEKVTFDIGYTKRTEMDITVNDVNFVIYVITGEDEKDIVKQFRQMIGQSYIAPKWALGYGQSRWSYMNEGEIREVVKNYRDNQIPLDMVYLDIDYMERYKDFTVNKEAFPDLEALAKEMKEQGIRLVPIIDAGVKIEEGYDIYEEGLEKGYFCKKEDGTEFVAGVWPGKVHFPDMLNDEARNWFGKKYKVLLDKGIEGFWNDMNEPAIFYSEDRLKKAFEELAKLQGENLDIYKFFHMKDLVLELANNKEDYASFYHEYKGQRIRHDKVHNLYGYYMTRAAGEAFDELEPDKRILMFSRASYIGMHRYGGIWTGDNMSWWSHLLLNIRMMPALNMCGFLYTGADLGGFGAHVTEDLMLRWLEFGIFTPLMRNHSALGTRRQEAYQFEDKKVFANIIGIRYGILPYIYSEYMKSSIRDEMMFRPLAFDYREDSFAKRVEDQLLVGDSIMIAPVYEQNAKGRYVYLPEKMKMVKMKSLTERTYEILEKGHHYIDVDLDEVIFFIRPDKLIPLSKGGQFVEEVDFEDLELLSFVETEATYELYTDDGFTKEYDKPEHFKHLISK